MASQAPSPRAGRGLAFLLGGYENVCAGRDRAWFVVSTLGIFSTSGFLCYRLTGADVESSSRLTREVRLQSFSSGTRRRHLPRHGGSRHSCDPRNGRWKKLMLSASGAVARRNERG